MIYPVISFGIKDPQHYSKIMIVWLMSLAPLALFFLDIKLAKYPHKTSFNKAARIVTGITLLTVIFTFTVTLPYLLRLPGNDGSSALGIAPFYFISGFLVLVSMVVDFAIVSHK